MALFQNPDGVEPYDTISWEDEHPYFATYFAVHQGIGISFWTHSRITDYQ